MVGLEVHGEFGLLRSLAVASPYRGKGIGMVLCERILDYAHLQGIKELYLFTMTADNFFAKLGFIKIDQENIPKEIQDTEIQTLCPSTAICMFKRIENDAKYYPKDLLSLKPVIPGAKMWGVALDKAMLTYFEVQSHSRFENHCHESEQITLVLEGELFFETRGKIIDVKEGEVIAIPSGVSHAVFTKDKPVKAVDAWSPVMEEYRR